MEIERINENTVKFFLSYIDIEERGFTREEVWYNRDKSEELFWEMMDEINDETEFSVEGPLWIQVHAMSGGIEVTVTRAQMTPDGQPLESPYDLDDPRRMFQQDGEMLDNENNIASGNDSSMEWLETMFVFNDFEDLIPLAPLVDDYTVKTSLYSYEDRYYLHVDYIENSMDDPRKADLFSVISEFGTSSNITIHRLEEYGIVVMESDVFNTIQQYFAN